MFEFFRFFQSVYLSLITIYLQSPNLFDWMDGWWALTDTPDTDTPDTDTPVSFKMMGGCSCSSIFASF